jgi:hypothetical protein
MFVSAYVFTTYAHGAKVSLGAGIGKILAFFVGLDYNQTYRTCPLCPTIRPGAYP